MTCMKIVQMVEDGEEKANDFNTHAKNCRRAVAYDKSSFLM